MRVAILTFDGFNEIDSFIALGLINRLKASGWSAEIAAPAAQVTSMNGVTCSAQHALEFANEADAVLFGSGIYHARHRRPDHEAAPGSTGCTSIRCGRRSARSAPARCCWRGSACIGHMPACADATIRPWMMQAGVRVVDEPFHARGPVATAGGCMASVYLAAWVMARRRTRRCGDRAAPRGTGGREGRSGSNACSAW